MQELERPSATEELQHGATEAAAEEEPADSDSLSPMFTRPVDVAKPISTPTASLALPVLAKDELNQQRVLGVFGGRQARGTFDGDEVVVERIQSKDKHAGVGRRWKTIGNAGKGADSDGGYV